MGLSRLTVGDFLSQYPEFEFDLEEFLLSHRFTKDIKSRSQACTFDKDDSWKRKRVIEVVRHKICASVLAYTQYSQFSDVLDFPFIDKDTIRADPDSFVSTTYQRSLLWRKQTSGTTGPPVTIYYSPDFYFDHLLSTTRKIATIANAFTPMFGTVFSISITDNQSCRDFVLADPTGEMGLQLQVVMDERRVETIERLFYLFEMLTPHCITGKPSVFEILIDFVTNQARPIKFFPRLSITSGAGLIESLRIKIEEVLGTTVINAYGLTEFGLVAAECHYKSGLHIIGNNLLAEVVGSDGKNMPLGMAGELVVTSVNNLAMPLLRYKTGDIAQIENGFCSCGIIGQKISYLQGRQVKCFRFKTGALFSPTHFNNLFAKFPLQEFQMTQQALDRIEMLVEVNANCKNINETLQAIDKYVCSMLPSPVYFTIAVTKFNRDSKFERYRSAI
jgi:phenylacetate-CoA ligase